MHVAAVIFGLVFLGGVLLDAFQTIILPRRPVGRLRITRIFFLLTWGPWRKVSALLPRRSREQLYSVYGPLALLLLFVLWAGLLTAAFGLIYFGMHMPFTDPSRPDTPWWRLLTCLYVSGTTIFTLGLGDVQPATHVARALIVAEAGTGLGFVALVIGYVPVLYGAFSAREIAVAMLDARAGSPPTAGELLYRHSFNGGQKALTTLLAEWERWCAEMLETHISYPILCYYRSQHDNQSWLAALVTVLDACALMITTVDMDTAGDPTVGVVNHLSGRESDASIRQAQLTFAIARHTLVDLGHVFHREVTTRLIQQGPLTRLPEEEFGRLCGMLEEAGLALCKDVRTRERLLSIRKMYEPEALALAEYLRLTLPRWSPPVEAMRKHDVWMAVSGLRAPAALAELLTEHVSSQSAASHLLDDEAHRF